MAKELKIVHNDNFGGNKSMKLLSKLIFHLVYFAFSLVCPMKTEEFVIVVVNKITFVKIDSAFINMTQNWTDLVS